MVIGVLGPVELHSSGGVVAVAGARLRTLLTLLALDAGRVVAAGSPAELTERGESNQLRFRARPGLDLSGLLDRLPPGLVVTEPRPGSYVVQGRVRPEVLAAVTAWCAERGIMPEGLSVQRNSLEDVFLELTGRGQRG